MVLSLVKELLDAEIITGEEFLNKKAKSACGSDMMSDVLAYVKDQSVLLTGLVNLQAVRTAFMMDMICIVFVRGKEPTADIVEFAKEKGIVLLRTQHRMYTACGILYHNGLQGGKYHE